MPARDFVQLDLFPLDPEPAGLSFNDEMRLQIAKRDGLSPDCTHLSLWNKWVCNSCGACKQSDVPLTELCTQCHTSSFCAGCCFTCKDKCNSAQQCRWPGAR
jgi:hypothetical protein